MLLFVGRKERAMSDLIRRQDAIDVIMGEPTDAHYPSWYADKIKALPSADIFKTEACRKCQQTTRMLVPPKTGEWTRSNLLPNGWHCSHCDSPIMTDDIEEMLFCPNCGARMKGADNE